MLLSPLCYRHKEQRCGLTLPLEAKSIQISSTETEGSGGERLMGKIIGVNTATAVFNLPKENM